MDWKSKAEDEQPPREPFQPPHVRETQLCPRGRRPIETASLIAEINLPEWRALLFFMGTTQTPLRRKAESLHSLFFFFFSFCWPSAAASYGPFFCRAEKRIDKLLPFRFFKLQRSAAQRWAGWAACWMFSMYIPKCQTSQVPFPY